MLGDTVLGISVVEEVQPLSDGERTYLVTKIRAARMKLVDGKHNRSFFDAAKWVINVHAFHAILQSEFVPGNEFGARFMDFARYIERKEKEAETEEPDDEEEWAGSEPVYPPNL